MWFDIYMPKAAEDLRLHGVTFDEGLKRLVSAPPPPTSKKSKQKKALSRKRK
jgi:hypothetical protein